MRARWLWLCAAVLVAGGVEAPAALASGGSAAVCGVTAHMTLSPGLSMTPSSGVFGTYQDIGQNRAPSPGTITCAGELDGAAVTGPGQVWVSGSYGTGALSGLQNGDTCIQGSGSAEVKVQVPTSAGVKTLFGQISIVTAGTTGAASGSVGGATAGQLFQFSADPGQDCVNTPVTGLSVSAQGISLGTGSQ